MRNVEKALTRALVLRQEPIAEGIFSLWLREERIARQAAPGQFVSVYCNDKSRLLPRPISICETNPEEGHVRLVYRAAGEGTREFSALEPGDAVDLLGPLGNGFPLEQAKGKSFFLIGGGIGIPPMVELAKRLSRAGAEEGASHGGVRIIAGYRSERFLTQELESCGALWIATEDGSAGTRGTVLDCIRENGLRADGIFACGPTPMLRALQAYAREQEIPCWISLEQRMACGIGACLACVCKSKEKDAHSQVYNKRICAEGPVFAAEDVIL